MSSLIYTNQRSKLSKRQRAQRDELLKQQREIRKQGVEVKLTLSPSVPAGRSTRHIPSRGDGVGTAAMKDTPQYTGDKMIGIGQMHKSNAVPVFKSDDAKDLASMRR